jgi:hypothetical protein
MLRRGERVSILFVLVTLGLMALAVYRDDAFFPQLVATLIGAVFGIPVGLWANRIVARQAAENEARQIVGWLHKELADNLNAVRAMGEGGRKDYPAVMAAATTLRDDLWHSVSSAGKVGILPSADLIRRLADAYNSVSVLRLLARLFFHGDQFVRLPSTPGFNAPFDDLWWKEVEKADVRLRHVTALTESYVSQSID